MTGASAAESPARGAYGYAVVAASITAIVLGANTPLPILTVYQTMWGFSTGELSLVYGLYTVGVLASVFVLGPASDLIGRKRVLLPAFATMALGLVLGLLAPNIQILMLSRVLEGLAVGAGVTTAVAALGEYNPVPDDHTRVALTATVATVLGLAGGPLVAGALAQFAPWPIVTPYVVALALVGAPAIAILGARETVTNIRPFRLQTVAVHIPREAASAFALAIFVEMTAYAVAGAFAGLGPSFARELLGVENHFFGGLIVALLFLASAAAQIASRHWPPRRCIGAGLSILVLGLAIFAISLVAASAATFLLAAAILGVGHGLAYLGAQELTDRVAPPEKRAQIFSAFQLGLYFGATAPALIVGFAAGRIGLTASTLGFAGVVGALALVGVVWSRASRAPALRG